MISRCAANMKLTDDQCFLLCVIIGVYFAPDLKGRSYKSALQRRAERLRQYHRNDLAGSQMKIKVIESVYYYVLRNAENSVVIPQATLSQYVHGSFLCVSDGPASYPQFEDLFPANVHTLNQLGYLEETINDVVFLDNPETSYLTRKDIQRFKRLTLLERFCLDREIAVLHSLTDQMIPSNGVVLETPGDNPSGLPCDFGTQSCNSAVPSSSAECLSQGIIFLPSYPSLEQWGSLVSSVESGFAVTGSAARGNVGPVIGLMDVGESEDSYLFRVSLPGVKRDERDFSCEVESNGSVIIKGETVTGEETVEKHSQTFRMRSQHLCPPGPFTISFKLPGPVDPRQFHGTFATDGILEGIAFKRRTDTTQS